MNNHGGQAPLEAPMYRSCNCSLNPAECCAVLHTADYYHPVPLPKNRCDHCYCQPTQVGNVPHNRCCNCGNLQATAYYPYQPVVVTTSSANSLSVYDLFHNGPNIP